jgi:hypothetical protein
MRLSTAGSVSLSGGGASAADDPGTYTRPPHHRGEPCRRLPPAGHLIAIPEVDHRAEHAAARRPTTCRRHNVLYRRTADGSPACRKCPTEADARYPAQTPLTNAQRRRRNELAVLRYHAKRHAAARITLRRRRLGTTEPTSRIMVRHNVVSTSKTPVPQSLSAIS